MTTLQRAIRVYKDSAVLGLPNQTIRLFIIKATGERPGKDWLKRVDRIAKAEGRA